VRVLAAGGSRRTRLLGERGDREQAAGGFFEHARGLSPRTATHAERTSSPNCMKVRILLRLLDVPHERVTLDMFRGETRGAAHFARNPDGRVPTLELDDGTTIAESGAIMLYLVERTRYLYRCPCYWWSCSARR
jgi:hypothetical protein